MRREKWIWRSDDNNLATGRYDSVMRVSKVVQLSERLGGRLTEQGEALKFLAMLACKVLGNKARQASTARNCTEWSVHTRFQDASIIWRSLL